MELPMLFKKDSKGKLRFWKIEVLSTARAPYIEVSFGVTGGTTQKTCEFIHSGKNLGKANATTPMEQAILEATSKWNKQQDRKGYSQSKEEAEVKVNDLEPMLAHRYDKFSHKINFPCCIQPKLDGFRILGEIRGPKAEDVILYTRQKKVITGLPHINKALTTLWNPKHSLEEGPLVVDGEAYSHDFKSNFEGLASFISSQTPKEGCEVVKYHIYDLVDLKRTFNDRNKKLVSLIDFPGVCTEVLKYVPTAVAVGGQEVKEIFEFYIQSGYEGAMLRNRESLYVGKRSYDLQKVKSFMDAEFEIVKVKEGKGRLAGHGIFTCALPGGSTFDVKMKGSNSLLKDVFDRPHKYIGKNLTVVFQNYTNKGVPRFPVGLRLKVDI